MSGYGELQKMMTAAKIWNDAGFHKTKSDVYRQRLLCMSISLYCLVGYSSLTLILFLQLVVLIMITYLRALL